MQYLLTDGLTILYVLVIHYFHNIARYWGFFSSFLWKPYKLSESLDLSIFEPNTYTQIPFNPSTCNRTIKSCNWLSQSPPDTARFWQHSSSLWKLHFFLKLFSEEAQNGDQSLWRPNIVISSKILSGEKKKSRSKKKSRVDVSKESSNAKTNIGVKRRLSEMELRHSVVTDWFQFRASSTNTSRL